MKVAVWPSVRVVPLRKPLKMGVVNEPGVLLMACRLMMV